PAGAMVLPDGRIVTGKNSSLLGPSAALLMNAIKALAGIDKDLDLLPASIIAPDTARMSFARSRQATRRSVRARPSSGLRSAWAAGAVFSKGASGRRSAPSSASRQHWKYALGVPTSHQ
ncbi:MAG: DUF1846 family protein, partial [Firmicutes bacterium]|nr:DUF1846 family protein [Bacillota bacterium]